jgi:hypothetical protein
MQATSSENLTLERKQRGEAIQEKIGAFPKLEAFQ